MKNKKIIICLSTVLTLLFISVVLLVFFSYSDHKENVNQLNMCYKLIESTNENGFNIEDAEKNKLLFKEVLENGVNKIDFIRSEFYKSSITFSEISSWNCPEFRVDLNAAHCRDLILAMYLSCVLATESESLSEELEWLKGGIWQIDPTPEFIHLIANKYNPSNEDIDILVNSIITFSDTLEQPEDKYNTRAFVYTFINNYNEKHKDDKYILKNEKEFLEDNIEIFEKIDEENYATIWVGYGKAIDLD